MDSAKLFKYTIAKLTEEINDEQLNQLEQILQQTKTDEEIIADIISTFPQFLTIYSQIKKTYATS